jgi:hypothetical protein
MCARVEGTYGRLGLRRRLLGVSASTTTPSAMTAVGAGVPLRRPFAEDVRFRFWEALMLALVASRSPEVARMREGM